MTVFRDSLGFVHHLHEPLLKAFCPAPAEPPPGEFRRLVDEIVSMRSRRRMAERVKNTPVNTRDPKSEKEAARASTRADNLPAIRQRPGRPASAVNKSFAAMAADLDLMLKSDAIQREAREADQARSMISDLSADAKAGRLDAISAAKVDALCHNNARALGLEVSFVRQ